MADAPVTYRTKAERDALVIAAEAAGKIMLHDEIRGQNRVLIFGTEADLPPPKAIEPPDPAVEDIKREIKRKLQEPQVGLTDQEAEFLLR